MVQIFRPKCNFLSLGWNFQIIHPNLLYLLPLQLTSFLMYFLHN
jgi:hypothetical protein